MSWTRRHSYRLGDPGNHLCRSGEVPLRHCGRRVTLMVVWSLWDAVELSELGSLLLATTRLAMRSGCDLRPFRVLTTDGLGVSNRLSGRCGRECIWRGGSTLLGNVIAGSVLRADQVSTPSVYEEKFPLNFQQRARLQGRSIFVSASRVMTYLTSPQSKPECSFQAPYLPQTPQIAIAVPRKGGRRNVLKFPETRYWNRRPNEKMRQNLLNQSPKWLFDEKTVKIWFISVKLMNR